MRKRLTDSFTDVLVQGNLSQTILSHSNSFSIEKEKKTRLATVPLTLIYIVGGYYEQVKENRLRRMKYQALCAYRLTFPALEGPCSGLSEKTFTCDFPWYAQQIMEGTLL